VGEPPSRKASAVARKRFRLHSEFLRDKMAGQAGAAGKVGDEVEEGVGTPLYSRQTVRSSVNSVDFEVFIRQPLDFAGRTRHPRSRKCRNPLENGWSFWRAERQPSVRSDGCGGLGLRQSAVSEDGRTRHSWNSRIHYRRSVRKEQSETSPMAFPR